MRDVIWTIIICWAVYKIWNAIKSTRTVVFQKNEQHHHYHQNQHNTEGKTTVEQLHSQKKSDRRNDHGDDSEYVDFEEIKK